MLCKSRTHRIFSVCGRICFSNTHSRYSAEAVQKQEQAGLGVQIPRKKVWGDTAVLQALCDVTQTNSLKFSNYPFECPSFQTFSNTHDVNVLYSAKQGRMTAKFIKERFPNYFDLDWLQAPGVKVRDSTQSSVENSRQDGREIDPDIEIIEDLIEAGDREALGETCIRKLANGEVIPSEVLEKCIAFISFIPSLRHKGPRNFPYDNVIEDLLKHTKSPSAYCVYIRSQAMRSNTEKVYEYFEAMMNDGLFPDLGTINYILKSGRDNIEAQKVASRIFKEMKNRGMQPNLQTLVGKLYCINIPARKNLSKLIIEKYVEVLGEAEHCGFNDNLELYLEMLKKASNYYKDRSVTNTVLDVLDGKQFKSSADAFQGNLAFSSTMKFAADIGDLALAKKTWRIASQESYIWMLLRNYPKQHIYTHYIRIICSHGSIEEIMDALGNLVPFRINYFELKLLLPTILLSAVRTKCPAMLPYLYAESDMGRMDDDLIVSNWLNTAIVLLPYADDDTVTQFNNIALLIKRSILRERWQIDTTFISNLYILVAKSKDSITLMELASSLKRIFPSVGISDSAMAECLECLNATGDPRHFQSLYGE